MANGSEFPSWQIISPVEVVVYVIVVDELLSVQNNYEKPTILVEKSVKGEEEIPDGAVALITPDMPDVLSHVSIRARNGKVCFLASNSELKEIELQSSSDLVEAETTATLRLVRKQFGGCYAILADEFTSEMVGAKSRNIAYLKGKVPSWEGIPTSMALPFGH